MSKRVLSLLLVLTMLVLAVPVFALPTLAAETAPVVKFAVQNNEIAVNTEGTILMTSTVEQNRIPTDWTLKDTGLTADDVIGWYHYDAATDSFIDAQEYLLGYRPLNTDVTVYPITKTTYTNGYNAASDKPAANMPIVSGDVVTDENGAITQINNMKFGTWVGGWTMGSYSGSTFSFLGKNIQHGDFPLLKSATNTQGSGCYYYKHSYHQLPSADSTYLVANIFHAVAGGNVTVTIPATNRDGFGFAVAVNGTYVYPEALKGVAINASAEQKADFEPLNYIGKWTFSGLCDADNITATFDLDLKAGDKVQFLATGIGTTATATASFYPTVAYNTVEKPTLSMPLPYVSEFSDNRPTNNSADLTTAGRQSEAVVYPGAWEYVSYPSKTDALAGNNRTPLTTMVLNEERWLVSEGGKGNPNGTKYASVVWRADNNPPSATGYWTGGGIDIRSLGYIGGVSYTAEYSGTVKLSFETIGNWQSDNNPITVAHAILVDGVQVWPANNADWYNLSYGEGATHSYGTNYAAAANATMPESVDVEKGQTIEFLALALSGKNADGAAYGGWTSRANYVEGIVTYTAVEADPLPSSAFSANRPTNVPGSVATGETAAVVYPGAWQYVTFSSKNDALAGNVKLIDTFAYIAGVGGYLTTSSEAGNPPYDTTGYVSWSSNTRPDAPSSYWCGTGMGFGGKEKVIGTRYTAEHTGTVALSFEMLGNWHDTASQTRTVSYAILVDGVQVWPTANAEWYTINYGTNASYGTNYAADANATMPGSVSVKKGQTIDFVALAGDGITSQHSSRANYIEGIVTYTSVSSIEAPEVSVAPSIGGTLDLTFVADDPCYESGVLVNGAVANKITVAPQNADADITVQSFVKVEGDTIYGVEKTITFNSVLEKYLGDETHGAAATAALAYTKAFAAYFAEGGVVDAATATGSYTSALSNSVENTAATVDFRGISLLLNDKINIKVVVDGTAAYQIEIADNAAFTDSAKISGTTTEDGNGTKYIMDGISALEWNTAYYFRIVDASGAVVSDTICYSVATYYVRMQADADANIKNLTATMMNLYEAVK